MQGRDEVEVFFAALVIKEHPLLESLADRVLPDPGTAGQAGRDLERVERPAGVTVGIVDDQLSGRIVQDKPAASSPRSSSASASSRIRDSASATGVGGEGLWYGTGAAR